MRKVLEELRADRAKEYTRLQQTVAEQAPLGPAVVERLRTLLPPEAPPKDVLSIDDIHFLLRTIGQRQFDESRRMDAIVQTLADHSNSVRP